MLTLTTTAYTIPGRSSQKSLDDEIFEDDIQESGDETDNYDDTDIQNDNYPEYFLIEDEPDPEDTPEPDPEDTPEPDLQDTPEPDLQDTPEPDLQDTPEPDPEDTPKPEPEAVPESESQIEEEIEQTEETTKTIDDVYGAILYSTGVNIICLAFISGNLIFRGIFQ